MNARPFAIWIAKVWKNPGVTIWKPAPGRADGSATGLPTIVNGIPKFVPCRGMPVPASARITPGSDSIFSDELLVIRNDLLGLREPLLRHRKVESENVIGAEAGIDPCQVPEAVDGKTCTGQQG